MVEIPSVSCARQIWLLSAVHNFHLVIRHKAGVELLFVDALSRKCDSFALAKTAAAMIAELKLVEVIPTLLISFILICRLSYPERY